MSNGPRCPKCGSGNLRWVTMRRSVPVDVLQCQQCSTPLAEEDWIAPLLPLVPNRCINCGDLRSAGVCTNCGLNKQEDVEVHQELKQVVLPNGSMLDAAKEASRQGRRLIALKLATAAAAMNENNQADPARALRVWLLAALGEQQSALEDAKAWVEHHPNPPAIAWASLGQQQQHGGLPGFAADSYNKALQKDGNQHNIRARRAQLLMQLRREGQASEEACLVFEAPGVDEASVSLALEVAEKLANMYETAMRDDEIQRLLERAGPHVDRSPALLAHRARLFALAGDAASARRDLKAARRIDPNLTEAYERVERAIKPQRTSWWRW